MKKTLRLFLSVLTSIAAFSCVIEETTAPTEVLIEKIFTGQFSDNADIATKTTLDSDFGILWSTDDHITVFSTDGAGTSFTDVTVDETKKVATFKGSIQWKDSYYALYPKQENSTYDSEAKTITATLPTLQTPKNGSFADGVNLAIAESNGDNLHFKNVGAIIAVKCPTNYASSVKLISRDPAVKMSGRAAISCNNGEPTALPTDDAINYVQMNEAGNKVNQTFYFVVYPGVYSKGFDIVINNSAGTHSCVVSSSKEYDIKRNDNILLYSPSSFVGWNAPSAPYNIKAQISEGDTPGIKLTWSSKAESSLLSGYNVYVRQTGSYGEAVLKGTTKSKTFDVKGLTNGRHYDLGVSAKGASGKKDSEIVWIENIQYKVSGDVPVMYPFEENRGQVPQFADMTLCYGGNPTRIPQIWDKERWRRHAVYTDVNGKDFWLFDSFLALEFKTTYAGQEYVYDLANTMTLSAGKDQWIQQLDYWFDKTNGFQALDDCIDEAIATAGPYPHKRYVVFSLPDPIYFQKFQDKSSSTAYWGEIDGVKLDFSNIAHRKKAYVWMIDQVRSRFAEKGYKHIELGGFYILQECLSETYNSQYKKYTEVISHAAEHCLMCNEGLYWIPYGYSSTDTGHNDAIKNWEKYGFTSVVLQPNKYWDTWRDWTEICQTYINNENLCMEFEFEGSHGEGGWSSSETPRTSSSILEIVRTDYDAQGTPKGSQNPQAERNRQRFREYMQNCKDFGIYGNKMLVLYTGSDAWAELAGSTAQKDKDFYHEVSKFFLLSGLKQTAFSEKLSSPTGVFVEQKDESSTILSWEDKNSSESGYRVYKCTGGNTSDPASADKGPNITEYQFNYLTTGTSYIFGVQTLGNSSGTHSEIVYADEYKMLSWEELQSFNADYNQKTGAFTGTYRECGAPQNTSWNQTSSTGGTISWTCWSSAETGFNIYIRKASETSWSKNHLKATAEINATSAAISGLEVAETYTFGVQTAGKTMARNSNIITVGTYTMQAK